VNSKRRFPTCFLSALILAGAMATLVAQSGSTPASSSQPAARKDASQASTPKRDTPLTLTGCVQLDETKADRFTLSDNKTGATYHLTGANVKAYVWRNVRIVGGLVPSANIAAQAGAIDPAKTAVASEEASRPGTFNGALLELRVNRVRPLTGSCSPKSH
jgi:hypothetical protein